jgi:cell division protein FtsI (penicillin-binding protein 3)
MTIERFKFFILHFVVFAAWAVLITRTFILQVTPNEKLENRIESQFASHVKVNARRGNIYDKNGKILATSVSVWSAFLDPERVTQKDRLVDSVSEALNIERKTLYRKVGKSKRFVWLKRKLSETEYKKLSEMGFKGLNFVEEYKRVYFNRDSLSFLIGKTDIDGKGLSGIELQYDEMLKGDPLKFKTLRDGKGRPLVFSNEHILDQLSGQNIYLNIDTESQVFFAKTLKERVVETKAKRGWGLLIEARTGKIVSSVQYDSRGKRGFEKNIAVSEIHEPGSVLKTFSFVKAMDELSIEPSALFSCGDEGFLIGRRKIKNSHKEECEEMTLLQAFAKSLNTVSAELALRLGAKRLVSKYQEIGFDKKTGVDFPGEVSPMFHKKLTGKHHLASLSFGHGISLSSLQVAKGYVALANDGLDKEVSYLKAYSDGDDIIEKINRSGIRVLSKKEVFLARGMLSQVMTEEGSGSKARVDGYLVGGKTGTSQKTDFINGGYSKEVLSSFVGVFPLSKPKYVAMVVIDEPDSPRSGGASAGPVFAKLAEYVLQKDQIMPDKIEISKIRDLASLDVKKENKIDEFEKNLVPNLEGYSLREALQVSRALNITLKVKGSGKVSSLSPKPGKLLPKTKVVSLTLE